MDVISVTARGTAGRYTDKRVKKEAQKDRAAWLVGLAALCAGVGEDSETPWRLVLLGAPGVGKGTQADLLSQRLGTCHLSTGDIFRTAGSGDCPRSPAMKLAAEYMRRGELVPDAIVREMVRERVTCLRCDDGFILDGFPRTLSQAECLKELMDGEGIGLTAVVNYALPLTEVATRLSGRRTCEKCKAVYHLTERPPKVAERCDRCDGKLFQREDDRPEAVKVRLESYERSIVPVAAFYTKLCLLVKVEANGSPEEICDRTLAKLNTHWARRVGPVAARD